MKNLLFLMLFLCFAFVAVAQSKSVNLRLKSAQPVTGKEIKFTYEATGTDLEYAAEIEAVALVLFNKKSIFEEEFRQAYDVPLKLTKLGWVGKFTPPAEATAIFFKFSGDNKIDENKGEGYYVLLHDKKKQPVPGARLALADMVGSNGYLVGMKTDPEKALPLYEEEFAKHPHLKRPYLQDYLSILSRTKDKDDKGLVRAELAWLEKQGDLTSEEMQAMIYRYGALKETEKVDSYTEQLRQRDPLNTVFKHKRFNELQQEQDLAKKEEMLASLANDYPNDATILYFYTSLATAYAKEKNIAAFDKLVANHETADHHQVYKAAADALVADGEKLQDAEAYAAKAYAMAKAELNTPTAKKQPATSEAEWRRSRESAVGSAASTYGKLYVKQDDHAKALPYLEEAHLLTRQNSNSIIESYTEALQKNSHYPMARTILETRIAEAKGSAKMKELLKEGYAKENNGEEGFEDYWVKIEAPAIASMKRNLSRKMISDASPAFELTDLEGKSVSLASLKGKTVVLDFWATWCGPCIAAFPGMQQAVDKYKNDESVVFLFVNTWESAEDKKKHAGDFIAKKNYTFQVLMDEEDKMVKDFKVEGIPTKVVIDKAGNIRFVSVGYNSNTEQAVQELSMMIEMAKGQLTAAK